LDPDRYRPIAGLIGKLADRLARVPAWQLWLAPIPMAFGTVFFVANVQQGQTGWAIVFGILLVAWTGTVVTAIVLKIRSQAQGPAPN
jgi:hypothetical protein